MEFEKLYAGRGVSAAAAVTAQTPARRVLCGEDAADTFAHILQNLRAAKPANSRARDDNAEGDTVVTRVLADGSVIVQVFRDNKLISESMTRGSDPAAGKEIMSTQVEKKVLQDPDDPGQNPLRASRAAQGAVGTAAAAMMSTML